MNNNFNEDVRLAKNGDTAAFSRLYALMYEDMYRIALYSLRNTHDACDAVSDTVLDAFCSIGKLRDEKAFRMWMMRILSAKIKRKQCEYFADTVELTEEVEPAVEFDSEMSELKHAMNNLDPQSRMCLSMSVIEGYTGEEISKICGINANTVRSLIMRAKKKLRMAIEG